MNHLFSAYIENLYQSCCYGMFSKHFNFHAQFNIQYSETLTNHINQYSITQAIFIRFAYYIRRLQYLKIN